MAIASVPTVFVISPDKDLSNLVSSCYPTALEIVELSEPAEALRHMQAGVVPLLVVIMIAPDTRHWTDELDTIAEHPSAPRRLLVVSPSELQDVLHDLYNSVTDHLVLWPADPDSMRSGLGYLLSPPSPAIPAFPVPNFHPNA